MPVFWRLGGFWINTDHIVAVREMRIKMDAAPKYKVLLDNPLGELPGELLLEGSEAQELLRLLGTTR